MFRQLQTIFLSAILLLLGHPAMLKADSVLCLRNKAKADGTVNFKKAIKVRQDTCLAKETRIDTTLSAASVLTLLLTADGTGSGLDADTLDGIDSSSFASAADMSAAEASITSLQGDVSALQSDMTSAESDISTLEGNVTTLQSTTSSHTSSISSLNSSLSTTQADVEDLGLGTNLVRVGDSNSQYTDLGAAVSFVASQVRSARNRWVILIGPGEFELDAAITIPTYTSLRGSGKHSTIITNTDGLDVASLVTLSDYTELSDMTVKVDQTASLGNVGVIDNEADVDANPDNPADFPSVIRDARIEITSVNPDGSTGIFTSSADLKLERVEIVVSGSSTFNYGISATTGSSDILIYDSQIYASDALSYGILDQQSGETRISNSVINAAVTAVSKLGGPALIRSTHLISGSICVRAVSSNIVSVAASTFDCVTHRQEVSSGNVVCANSNDENGVELNSDCQ